MPQKPCAANLIIAMTALALSPVPGAQADPGDTAALPPWGLTAVSTEAGVELSWNAPPMTADLYVVYRADGRDAVVADGLEAFQEIGQTTDLAFLYAGPLAEGNEPRGIYHVTALFGDDESLPSNPAGAQYPHCWNINEPENCFIP